MRTAFTMDLGDGLDLALRDESSVEPLHDLVLTNLERLRQWEGWAHGEQSVEAMRWFTRHQLAEWAQGRAIPCVLRLEGVVVGAVGSRVDTSSATADVGFWVDGAHEGRGLVSRATRALVQHLVTDRGVARVEIRTSVDNTRSRALAERLGFTHEGTLRSALPVGDLRHDVALYGLLATDAPEA